MIQCLIMAAQRRISKAAKRRQLAGSRRGSAVVRDQFESAITRRRFCALVGINATTLRKWEKLGVVEPRFEVILNSPTRVFSEADVGFGKRLIALLREAPGRYSVKEAADEVGGGTRGRGGTRADQ